MTKSIVITLGAAMIALSFANAPQVDAQITIIETTTPERRIPPPPEVRGKEHLAAKNPYFGLRSSFPNVRAYYSNPVKTIPAQTRRTIIYGGYPYYGVPAFPNRFAPRYPYGYGYGYQYGYGYPWGFRR